MFTLSEQLKILPISYIITTPPSPFPRLGSLGFPEVVIYSGKRGLIRVVVVREGAWRWSPRNTDTSLEVIRYGSHEGGRRGGGAGDYANTSSRSYCNN